MKITVDIDETTLKGLNNAVIAFGDACWSIMMCCETSNKLEPLKRLSDEELEERFNAVKALYMHLSTEYDNKGSHSNRK